MELEIFLYSRHRSPLVLWRTDLLPVGKRLGLPISIGLAVGANQLYVGHAVATIAKMHTAGGELSAEQLARAGEVSTTAGWIARGCYALLILLAIVGLVLQTQSR